LQLPLLLPTGIVLHDDACIDDTNDDRPTNGDKDDDVVITECIIVFLAMECLMVLGYWFEADGWRAIASKRKNVCDDDCFAITHKLLRS
jgi:hypothetical protein